MTNTSLQNALCHAVCIDDLQVFMPEKRKVGLKRESRSGNVYRGQRTKREMRGSGGEAVKECRASETHGLCTHRRPLHQEDC